VLKESDIEALYFVQGKLWVKLWPFRSVPKACLLVDINDNREGNTTAQACRQQQAAKHAQIKNKITTPRSSWFFGSDKTDKHTEKKLNV
jgi:hypothetical protein